LPAIIFVLFLKEKKETQFGFFYLVRKNVNISFTLAGEWNLSLLLPALFFFVSTYWASKLVF